MANITLSTTLSNLVVDSTNNIITVSSTPSNVIVGEVAALDAATVRSLFSNVSPILYNSTTGVFSFNPSATDSLYADGNVSGNVSINLNNGTVHTATLTGNITGINFTGLNAGSSVVMILTQGSGGNKILDTNTYVTNWTNWRFVGDATTLSTTAGTADILTVLYDGTYYNASLVNFAGGGDTVTVNGVAITLGGSGNITTGNIAESGSTNLYFSNARSRAAISVSDTGGLGALSYSNSTGVITYTGPSDSDVRTLISSANTTTGFGNISYNNSTGVITFDRVTNTNIRSAVSATTSGYGSLSYNSSTGVFSYTGPSNANIRSAFTQTTSDLLPFQYDSATGVFNFPGSPTFSSVYFTGSVSGNGGYFTGVSLYAPSNIETSGNIFLGSPGADFYHNYLTGTFLRGKTGFLPGPGNVTSNASLTVGGQLVANGNVTGTYFIGNGSQLTGMLTNAQVVSYIATQPLTVGGNLTVNGNINATGNINYQNVTDLYVTDQKITLNSNAATNANVQVIANRPTATNTDLKWNEPATRWEFTNNGTTYYPIPTSTTDLAEGSNLYFTAARARGNISVAENLTYNSSTGVIGMANSLANVNSIITETTANATVTADEMLEFKARKRNNTLVSGANIHAEGFAVTQGGNFFNAPIFSKTSGSGALKSYVFDATITSGSNVMTVSAIYDMQGVAASVSDVSQYYMFLDYPLTPAATAFPPGTYVTSVSGSNIYMSANATRSDTFVYDGGDPYASYGGLSPAAYDSTTGLLIGFESDYDDGGASTQTITFNYLSNQKNLYGYGAGGPVTTDFAYSRDSAANYSINTTVLNQFLTGRTNFSAKQTVGNFRRGLTIGDADLTNRGENDGLQTFGLGVVWDGTANVTADYGSSGIFPQILLKQYTTGTNQGSGGTALTNSGPRMLFIGANGKNTDAALSTYARNNQEVGRITWLSTTDFSTEPSTTTPPAFISVISNRDQTGTGPNDFGMYLVTSPSASNNQRAMWAGHYKANTIISAGSRSTGTSGNIIFAPARQSTNANTQLHPESIVNSACASPHWATIGYDNPAANTGARISVTNGNNAAAARNGNLTLALSRNSNFGVKEWALKVPTGNSLVLTEDGVIRTTFAAANITTAGNISASTFLGNVSGATGAFTGNVDVTGNLNLTGRLLGYDKVYGEFCYVGGNIAPAATNTIYTFPFDTTNMASDVIANNTSRINIVKPGIFKLIVSIQAASTNNSVAALHFWLRKNGADVTNSNTQVDFLKDQKIVIAMDWMVESNGTDYWEIAYAVDSTNITFPYKAAQASPFAMPAIPPVILNVIPVGA